MYFIAFNVIARVNLQICPSLHKKFRHPSQIFWAQVPALTILGFDTLIDKKGQVRRFLSVSTATAQLAMYVAVNQRVILDMTLCLLFKSGKNNVIRQLTD